MKNFETLTQREILALAISLEEEDERIFADFAEGLRQDFPASSAVFEGMRDEESGHRRRLIELYRQKFGEHIPLIRRQDVRGFVARPALWLTLVGILFVLLAASLLRLYFDLVEAYTVQLGTHLRPNGRPDRRVRHTLAPAFRLLRKHIVRAWLTFLVLAILGAIAVFFSGRSAMHMLAQPRVWPMFLVAQVGLFLMLFTRFWQRGAESSLVLQNPLLPEPGTRTNYDARTPGPPTPPPPAPEPSPDRPHHVEMIYNPDPLTPLYPAPLSADDPIAPLISHESDPPAPTTTTPDPIPNPEPASPSLDEPDPGVFHHEPQKPNP